MNYFEFYSLPVSFKVNEEEVKRKYFEFSKKYHPDFFVEQSNELQQEALEMSTLNTRAFQTLTDFDKRMKYVLELKGVIHEGERYELPPEFLMEMMDVNEELMELKMQPDQKKVEDFGVVISDFMDSQYGEVKSVIENYDDGNANEAELKKIKDYYYKKKYLLRLKESLDTFGAP